MNLNEFIDLDQQFLPVHVSYPISRIIKSDNYFKKIHLISDVLTGFFECMVYP